MTEKPLIHKEREKTKQIILERLKKEPAYRKKLHLLCCRKLGKSTTASKKPSRICADMQDSQFDIPLRELLETGLIRKKGSMGKPGNFMYYELVQKK
jgi:hypothetical protein